MCLHCRTERAEHAKTHAKKDNTDVRRSGAATTTAVSSSEDDTAEDFSKVEQDMKGVKIKSGVAIKEISLNGWAYSRSLMKRLSWWQFVYVCKFLSFSLSCVYAIQTFHLSWRSYVEGPPIHTKAYIDLLSPFNDKYSSR